VSQLSGHVAAHAAASLRRDAVGLKHGCLRGTPTQAGSFLLNISLTDSHGTPATTAKLSLTITQQNLPVITTRSLPNGVVSKTYPATQLQVAVGQSPYKWALNAGSLPAGLRMSSAGVITGTPGSNGSIKPKTFAFTVQVTDANNEHATANLSITVQSAGGTGPSGVAARAY
jgi:hypothetical protein